MLVCYFKQVRCVQTAFFSDAFNSFSQIQTADRGCRGTENNVNLKAIIELKVEFYSSIHFNCSELLRVSLELASTSKIVAH